MNSNKIAKELSTVQDRLNPKLWLGSTLKSDVRKKLLEIAIAFKEFVGVELEVSDCVIVGSAANYNWSAHSDIDLHLVVNKTATPVERELYDSKKMIWSSQHEITINGIEVECYVETADVKAVSGGVYSIIENRWLSMPSSDVDDVSIQKINAVVREIDLLIKTALQSKNLERIKRTKRHIFRKRKKAIRKYGERAVFNLAFKVLRRNGTILELIETIHDLETKNLSL